MNAKRAIANEDITGWQELEGQETTDNKRFTQNGAAFRTKVISFKTIVAQEESIIAPKKSSSSQKTQNYQLKQKFDPKVNNQLPHNPSYRTTGSTIATDRPFNMNTPMSLEITGTSNQKKPLTLHTENPPNFSSSLANSQNNQTEKNSTIQSQSRGKNFVIKGPRFPARTGFLAKNYALTEPSHVQERLLTDQTNSPLKSEEEKLTHSAKKNKSYGIGSFFSSPRNVKTNFEKLELPNKSRVVRISLVVGKIPSKNNQEFGTYERKNNVHSQKFSTPRFVNTKSTLEAIRPESYTTQLLRSPVQRPQTVATIQKVGKRDEFLFKSLFRVSSYNTTRTYNSSPSLLQPVLP